MSAIAPDPNPTAPPHQLFDIHELIQPDNTKGAWYGSAYDGPTATAIACAVWSIRERLNPETHLLLAVWNENDQIVAFLGNPAEVEA